MNKKIVCAVFCLLAPISVTSQSDSIQQPNPIVFGEFGFGIARFNNNRALHANASINYQYHNNFFSFRYSETAILRVGFLLIIPFVTTESLNTEYAVLYGKRWIENGHSTSLSLGFSYNQFKDDYDTNTNSYDIKTSHVGLPFEVNLRWFKQTKKKVRIYGLIPVGRPTGLGGSFGFKFSGNLSKKSYAALGIIYSFGFHKYY